MNLVFFAVEFLICAAYSLILERWKHLWEPDFTGVEVAIGSAICLATAAAQARWAEATTWQRYESAVWWSFLVGAVPIAIWQFWRLIRNRRRLHDRITRSSINGRTTTQAHSQTLAAAGRSSQGGDAGPRKVRGRVPRGGQR